MSCIHLSVEKWHNTAFVSVDFILSWHDAKAFSAFLLFCLLPHEQQQEQDPTNLYISNLPLSVDEKELENMLQPFGQVVSTRILRDYSGNSRGVGFARSVTRDSQKEHSFLFFPVWSVLKEVQHKPSANLWWWIALWSSSGTVQLLS